MVARSAGTFLGGITNNPGAVAILLGLGALLIFRKPILEALGNLKLPDINLPDINFGDFKLPSFDFDFGNVFGGVKESLDTIVTQFSNPLEPGREQGALLEDPPQVIPDVTGGLAERRRALDEALAPPTVDPGTVLDPNRPLSLAQIGGGSIQQMIESLGQVQTGIREQTSIFGTDLQTFEGGGPSFIGGSVTEIPIERLSLGGIIDRLANVGIDISASRAADILARAQDNFGDFDFGTNTGSGGGPSGFQILNVGEVSDPQFEGLLPSEIALRLTGGNISNF